MQKVASFEWNIVLGIFEVAAQVGFAELKEMANDRVKIGGTIIDAPILGQ